MATRVELVEAIGDPRHVPRYPLSEFGSFLMAGSIGRSKSLMPPRSLAFGHGRETRACEPALL